MLRFGKQITLSDGTTPILRDFQVFSDGTAKAFVEHDHPVPWGIDGKTVLGHAIRVWVPAPGFVEIRDRDGCKIGMRHVA